MKKFCLILVLIAHIHGAFAQSMALKTNLFYWSTLSYNVGLEAKAGQHITLALNGGYNPFTFEDNIKWKHFLIQPELRYWFCESFYGAFLSLDLALLRFNVGGIPLPYTREAQKHRYDGIAYLGGLSYGYSRVLGKRLNLEFLFGLNLGPAYYDRYQCPTCGRKLNENGKEKDLLLSPNLALSLIYMIK